METVTDNGINNIINNMNDNNHIENNSDNNNRINDNKETWKNLEKL